MVTAAAAKVGVEAVVGGLQAFKSAFGSMNDLLDKFGMKGNLLSKAFKPVTAVFDMLFESLRRIGEFVIAGLILRGIDAIANAIKNMAMEVYNAAVEFQLLKIRLESFLATDMIAAGTVDNMKEALVRAQEPAKELFDWMLKLAMTTPFDTQDVADTFTMAKAWGFATDEAKKLTIQVSDFAAGMGFGSQEMDRVIKALGQMKSLGRVAGQELLQLANAGVPVADIMKAIQEELGLTTKEFEKLRMKGGVSAEMFFEQWDKLIKERFEGSAVRASKTIKGVIGNIKDFFTGVFGMKVLVPILDEISRKFAGFLDALTSGDRFDRILGIVSQLSEVLTQFANDVLDSLGFGNPEAAAEKFVEILDKLKGKIIGILEVIYALMNENVTPGQGISAILQLLGINENTAGLIGTFADNLLKLKDRITEVFNVFKEEGFTHGLQAAGVSGPIFVFLTSLAHAWDNVLLFWDQNKETFKRVLKDVFLAISEAFGFASFDDQDVTIIEQIGFIIVDFTNKLLESAPSIVKWVGDIGKWIINTLIPSIVSLAEWIRGNQGTILLFLKYFVEGLAALYAASKIAAVAMYALGVGLVAGIGFVAEVLGYVRKVFNSIASIFGGFNFWYNYGRLLMDGMKHGLIEGALRLWASVKPYLQWVIDMVKWLLGIRSKSTVFADIGENMMRGMQKGIEDAMNLPQVSMKTAIRHILEPAINPLMMAGQTTNTTTQNFNLNINTQAKAEPLIADFRMMESLAGGG